MNVNASAHARIIFTVYRSSDLSYMMFRATCFLPRQIRPILVSVRALNKFTRTHARARVSDA